MSAPKLHCVVESPSLLHRRPGHCPVLSSSNPAVFIRPSSAQFQLQEALRQRLGQWQPPDLPGPAAAPSQRPVSALEPESAIRQATAATDTASGRTSVRSLSASSQLRRQQAILATRNQQALTDSVASWNSSNAAAQRQVTPDPAGSGVTGPASDPASANYTGVQQQQQQSSSSGPQAAMATAGRSSAALRKAPRSLIESVRQRLRDSVYDSPARSLGEPRPASSASSVPASAAASGGSPGRSVSRGATPQPVVSSIGLGRYGNVLSDAIHAAKPFTFEQQFIERAQASAADLRTLVAASSDRILQSRKFRTAKVKEAKEFWRNHPMPSDVDMNKLLPDRGNNLRSALRSVRTPVRDDDADVLVME